MGDRKIMGIVLIKLCDHEPDFIIPLMKLRDKVSFVN